MSVKPRHILVFADWYLPGFRAGGPIRSLASLVHSLPEYQFYIVTRHCDHHDTTPYEGVATQQWVQRSANEQVMYMDEKKLDGKRIYEIIQSREWDVIYLNSLFSPRFTQWPLRVCRFLRIKQKVLLAPRGMLQPSALAVKPVKKKVFLIWARWGGLYRGIHWHATSAQEAEEIKKHWGRKVPVHIAPNLSMPPPVVSNHPEKNPGELKLLTLARISPEKGIAEALHYLKAAGLQGLVEWNLYGALQNESYILHCKALAQQIPHVRITFHGELPYAQIHEIMGQHHLMYLPTPGENYGHAIADALVSGMPCLISDRTPWQRLREAGAGWSLPLSEKYFAAALNEALQMDDSAYRMMCRSATQYGREVVRNENALQAARQLFQYI